MSLYLLKLLLITGLLHTLCVAEDFFVAPTQTSNTEEFSASCHTLRQYAENTSLLSNFTNVSIFFLPGIHLLDMDVNISGKFLLTLQAYGSDETQIGVIVHANNAVISLQAQEVTIHKLTLEGVNIVVKNNLNLSVMIRESNWMQSHLKVMNNEFSKAQVNILQSNFQGEELPRGVAVQGNHINLTISDSSIQKYGFGLKLSGSGEVLLVNTSFSMNVYGLNLTGTQEVSITNCTIISSSTSGILLETSRAYITNTTIIDNNVGIISTSLKLLVQHSQLVQNGAGMTLIPPSSNRISSEHSPTVMIEECKFILNQFIGLSLVNMISQVVNVRNCHFHGNNGPAIAGYQSFFTLLEENYFSNNTAERGAGLTLYNSTVTFGASSSTVFSNNTASEFGGAIYISSQTPLLQNIALFRQTQSIRILGLPRIVEILSQSCFYHQTDNSSRVAFQGNNAYLGGKDIYGLTIFSCFPSCAVVNNDLFQFEKFQSTSQIGSDPIRVCLCENETLQCNNTMMQNATNYPGESVSLSLSTVGFGLEQVAGLVYASVSNGSLVDSEQSIQRVNLGCTTVNYTLASTQNTKPVSLTLTAQEQPTNDGTISLSQILQSNALKCVLQTSPIFINVTLRDCPLGLEPSITTGVCDCDQTVAIIQNNTHDEIACSLVNGTGYISREGTVWIGVDTRENDSNVYYWHTNCPYNFCTDQQVCVDLLNPDSQCAYNRSGVLCGKCKENYSLLFGGNNCGICDNSYLALLIVFAAFGILLVGLLKILNLTVADGTVNGCIFYANIVWMNSTTLFSGVQSGHLEYYLIALPIAWMNLDFGIETCFGNNLNQLTKTGLQFVFPVYIWCIAGLLIVIVQHSITATRLFGNNSVSVLPTLVLMSYAKVLRTIAHVFAFADINSTNGTIRKIWALDGNVQYGTGGHAILMVFASLFLLLVIVPFTLTLLLVPFLRSKSSLRPLRWIDTLNPFFDAFYGPFNDKKRYHVWPGILLLVRVIALIAFSSLSTVSPNRNIALMILMAVLLLLYKEIFGQIYKMKLLSQNESLLTLNLIHLGGSFLLYEIVLKEQTLIIDRLSPPTTIAVSITFIQFFIVFFILRRNKIAVTSKKLWIKISKLLTKKKKDLPEEPIESPPKPKSPTRQIIKLTYNPSEIRESILETPL